MNVDMKSLDESSMCNHTSRHQLFEICISELNPRFLAKMDGFLSEQFVVGFKIYICTNIYKYLIILENDNHHYGEIVLLPVGTV